MLASWLVRAAAVFLLLGTFGIGLSAPLAIMFICAGAASAAFPIGPAGAATQITAGTTVLVVSGVETSQALGLALAAQALLIFSGAAISSSLPSPGAPACTPGPSGPAAWRAWRPPRVERSPPAAGTVSL